MRVLDLCSGLGGFSAAFRERGHEVVTVDVDPRFNPTLLYDVRELHPNDYWAPYEAILASPPCQMFSIARRGFRGPPPPDKLAIALEIVRACYRIIYEAAPRWWVLENPRGLLRHHIGSPTETIFQCSYGNQFQKATDLWGKWPGGTLRLPCAPHAQGKVFAGRAQGGMNASLEKDPAVRALIAPKLSLELCLRMERELERDAYARTRHDPA